jgi:hypothetical protein
MTALLQAHIMRRAMVVIGIAALAVGVAVALAVRTDVPPDWLAKRKVFQALQNQAEGGGSPVRTVVVDSPDHHLYVRMAGKVTWAADGVGLTGLDGRIRIYQSDRGETRSLVIRNGARGIERRFWINGRPAPLDEAAQRWQSSVLSGVHDSSAS